MCGGAILKPKVQEELRYNLPHVYIFQGYGKYHYNTIKYYSIY